MRNVTRTLSVVRTMHPRKRTCDWCHEPEESCFCGAIYIEDEHEDPDGLPPGFHVTSAEYETEINEEDECL